MKFIEPKYTYKSILSPEETENAIKLVKDTFQTRLSSSLQLKRITAPLFVKSGKGLNDNLNGIEKPVSFNIKDCNNQQAEIVHSLAKWKRQALYKYNIPINYGVYTDMNAIRADEELDNLHSLYVDQWDWEMTINQEMRNKLFLHNIVKKIYDCIKQTEYVVSEHYKCLKQCLPDNIQFITTKELYLLYPNLSPKEREDEITKKYGAVFIEEIGDKITDTEPKHDGRAPDYDDWHLNGDIVVWSETLNRSFELSSMGIRVDKEILKTQMSISNKEYEEFHNNIQNDVYPLSLGGGIGQSRLCMFLLKKAHIGEIQSSIWPDEMMKICKKYNINLI